MNKTNCFLVMLSTIVLYSCTEMVDLDPRERTVVVHSILEDTTVQTVQLFYTSYMSENYCAPVEDAQVYIEQIKDSVAISRYDFHKVKDGIWQGRFKPNQLGIYKLTAIIPHKDTISAKTRFPLRVEFVKIRRKTDPDEENPGNIFATKSIENYEDIMIFSFMDYIPETGNYKLVEKPLVYTPYIGDGFYDEKMLADMFYKSEWFADYPYFIGNYAIRRLQSTISSVDSLSHANPERYKIAKYTAEFTKDNCTIGDYPMKIRHTVRKYSAWNEHTPHPLSYLIVQKINKDYELYMKDLIAKSIGLNRKNVSDLTHLWEKDEIYSNVNNALGIFAAKCRYELMVKDWQSETRPPLWEEFNIIIPGWND